MAEEKLLNITSRDQLRIWGLLNMETGARNTQWTYFTADDKAYIGKSDKSEFDLSLTDLVAGLEQVPDDAIYPDTPAGTHMTIAPKDLDDGVVFIKRMAFRRIAAFGTDPQFKEEGLIEALAMEKVSEIPHPYIVQYHGCRIHRGRITGIVLERLRYSLGDSALDQRNYDSYREECERNRHRNHDEDDDDKDDDDKDDDDKDDDDKDEEEEEDDDADDDDDDDDNKQHRSAIRDRFDRLDKEAFLDGIESAVKFLHSLGLAHNDIHPGNIMIREADDGSCTPVLIDFGACAPFGAKLHGRGTPDFMDMEDKERSISRARHDEFSLKRLREWWDRDHMAGKDEFDKAVGEKMLEYRRQQRKEMGMEDMEVENSKDSEDPEGPEDPKA